MSVQVKNPAVRWLAFLAILVGSGGLSYAAVRHAVAGYWIGSDFPDLWLRAATIEPSNAGIWYLLGRYREFDFEHGDIPLALSYYQRATSTEPIASLYWMDLAGTYETAGNPALAEQAYRAAQQSYPVSAEAAWRYGNFLLRQNRSEEAFRQIQRAISANPKLTSLAVSRCWRSTQDVDLILNSALPNTPEAYWGAIQFFIGANQPDAAFATWKKLAAENISFPLSRPAPLLDLLIQSGQADNAETVWTQALSAAGITQPADPKSGLIWDGGFEQDLLNAGFSWRYATVTGATLDYDEQVMHSGARSLSVSFDGTENVDFKGVWQYVAVKPSTAYRFSSYVRTDQLTTDSGISFQILDVSHPQTPAVATPAILGTHPWALNTVDFTTGPETHLLQIYLRRNPSNMLSNKVRGTVWVDDVSLVPAANSPAQQDIR